MKNVLIIGTGTIGLTLVGMLARHKDRLGIDNVFFNKNTPLENDSFQIKQIIGLGAKLVTDKSKFSGFKKLGMNPVCTKEMAIENATVVVDCTPKNIGLRNKREYYNKYKDNVKGFVAQGSENKFGKKFGYNLVPFPNEQFVQVVSCNTHSISVLLKSFYNSKSPETFGIISGDFCCLRRSNDLYQNSGFAPGVNANSHDDIKFGTHHCADAYELLKDQFPNIELYSSSLKLPTQYMHAIRFSIVLDSVNSTKIKTIDNAISCFKNNPMVALTNKMTSNQIFGIGRDFGIYGRILSQAIVCEPTISIRNVANHSIVTGISYTSQDGNSLISSISAVLHFIDPDTADKKIKIYNPYIFQEL